MGGGGVLQDHTNPLKVEQGHTCRENRRPRGDAGSLGHVRPSQDGGLSEPKNLKSLNKTCSFPVPALMLECPKMLMIVLRSGCL